MHGEARRTTPLFADDHGQPFKDHTFAALIMAVLTAVLGTTRAKLYSPHSWRVWLASSLRMADHWRKRAAPPICDATKPSLQ